MKPTSLDDPDETRAAVARRRLAQLAASFDAELPPPVPVPVPEAPSSRPRVEVPHLRVVVAVAVAAVLLLVWWLLAGRPRTSDPVAPLPFATSSAPGAGSPSGPSASPTAVELIVDVAGKVRRPGIVTLPPGSRVYEAIEAAGGLRRGVGTESLNLARQLTDGEQVLVGVEAVEASGQPAASPGGLGAGGSAAGVAKVNLNTATAEQLDALPGVGPVTAQSILGWRETNGRFGSVDDLLDVKGIGDATLAELRDLVVV